MDQTGGTTPAEGAFYRLDDETGEVKDIDSWATEQKPR